MNGGNWFRLGLALVWIAGTIYYLSGRGELSRVTISGILCVMSYFMFDNFLNGLKKEKEGKRT